MFWVLVVGAWQMNGTIRAALKRRMQDLIRYQVFLSSTLNDLVEERRAVVQALQKLNCIPVGMELFPASDDDAWTLIRREIDNSDYYVVVSAGRYGSVDPNSELSYTEMEYDYAMASGKNVLGFIHRDLNCVPSEKRDKNPVLLAKLKAFQEKMKRKHVNFWADPQELEIAVITSCVSEFRLRPAEGWVRARSARRLEDLEKVAELQEKVQALEMQIALQTRINPSYHGLISISSGAGREEAFQGLRNRAQQHLIVVGVGMTRLARYARQTLMDRAHSVSIDLLMIDPEYLKNDSAFTKHLEDFLDMPDFLQAVQTSFDSLKRMAEESNAIQNKRRISLSVYTTLPTVSTVVVDPDLPAGELIMECFLYQCGEYRPRFHVKKMPSSDALFFQLYGDVLRLLKASRKVVQFPHAYDCPKSQRI
jgi:Domain of unknown function (DUF4062)